MDKIYRIYLITCLVNQKYYVGITSRTLSSRWYHHTRPESNCTYLKNAILKYGQHQFKIEQIDQASSSKEALTLEKKHIESYNSLAPNGYNLMISGEFGHFSEESIEKLKDSQKKRWESIEEREYYSELWKQKFKDNPSLKMEKYSYLKDYVENKKEAVIAINITSFEVIKFSTINSAIEAIGNIGIYNNLSRKDIHAGGYMWFYHDDTRSDESYIEETKQILIDKKYIPGKLMNYLAWQDPEKRTSRIESMKEAASDRARPIVGVNRFDGSIIHIPSINEALKTTLPSGDKITWGSLRQSLVGNCKHAYNYCWFYKEDQTDEFYLEQAKQRLGSLFDETNMKPILAESLDGTITYRFNNLYEVETKGFNKKETRQVLTNRRKTYKGFKFTNI